MLSSSSMPPGQRIKHGTNEQQQKLYQKSRKVTNDANKKSKEEKIRTKKHHDSSILCKNMHVAQQYKKHIVSTTRLLLVTLTMIMTVMLKKLSLIHAFVPLSSSFTTIETSTSKTRTLFVSRSNNDDGDNKRIRRANIYIYKDMIHRRTQLYVARQDNIPPSSSSSRSLKKSFTKKSAKTKRKQPTSNKTKRNYSTNYNSNNPPKQRKKSSQKNSLLLKAKALNHEIIASPHPSSLLSLYTNPPIQSSPPKDSNKQSHVHYLAGGGTFNSVNFSTLLHRLARFATTYDVNAPVGWQQIEERRKNIIKDARFALLCCGLCEAVAGGDYTVLVADLLHDLNEGGGEEKKSDEVLQNIIRGTKKSQQQVKALTFNSREYSNLAWAIAKLKFCPPLSVYQRDTSKSKMELKKDLMQTSLDIRKQVFSVAKERAGGGNSDVNTKQWIPTLSLLTGKLLDLIAVEVLDMMREFKPQELANLLWAFATVGRADADLFEPLSVKLLRSMGGGNVEGDEAVANDTDGDKDDNLGVPKPQEISNSVWAFATAGLRGPGQLAMIKFSADCLDTDDRSFANEFKPQEIKDTAWGAATLVSKRGEEVSKEISDMEDDAVVRILRSTAQYLLERADEFKPQEISNTIWAFATVGFGCEESAMDKGSYNEHYIFLKSDKSAEDRDLVSRALDAVAKSAFPRLDRFRPQELNNLAWGFARLGHGGEKARELFEGIGQQILRRYKDFTPQDVGASLWSFATSEYFDEDVYRAAASRLTFRGARAFKPQEMSNTVWALATAGVVPKYIHAFDSTLVPADQRNSLSDITDDPITECFAAAASEIIRRPNDFKEQEIKDILWGFSKIGVRHPLLFKSVAEHLVGSGGRGLSKFSPQGLGNLAWAYAKQAQLIEVASESFENLNIGSNGRLAVFETCCLDVGEKMIYRLFASIAESGLNDNGGLDRFKPQDLGNTAWSFAALGMLHREFFDTVAMQVVKRLSLNLNSKSRQSEMWRFKPQEVANLVWSFATLNHPCPDMIDKISPYVVKECGGGTNIQNIARLFKRHELANIAWGCAVLNHYPEGIMKLIYTGFFGSGDITGKEKLAEIYDDGGLQQESIMTLFYVQIALEMEAPHIRLSLPDDFPHGWGMQLDGNEKVIPSGSFEPYEETTSMLELSTSRLQSAVSECFDRIGFNHVEEYVMGTDELLERHGIKLSSGPLEFLSIDIANVDDRIGIEVDGPAHYINILDGISKGHDNPDEDVKSHGFARRMGEKIIWQFSGEGNRQVNGPTSLKDRLLCHLGWRVAHLPFWDWHDLGGNPEDEDLYCRQLLQDVAD